MAPLKLSVAESGAEIGQLSAMCQELDQECKRLIANINSHEKDVEGMLDFLELLRTSASNDREALHALFDDDVRSALR